MHIVSAQVNGCDAIVDVSSRSGSSVGSTCIVVVVGIVVEGS
jgi:hypothetical protein